MKKLTALFLTILMVLTMSLTVFAAEGDEEGLEAQAGNSITVTNAKAGETYHLYKLFDLSLDASKGAYTYTLSAGSAWENFVTSTGSTWLAYDATSRVVTAKSKLTDSTVGEFAQAMLAYAKDEANGVTATDTATVAEGATTAVFSELTLGYYLIDTTVGSAVILETNNVNVSVADKSAGPRIEKSVLEDSSNTWGDKNTAAILQTVYYKVEISNVQKLYNVDMRDTMSAGLTFDPNSVKVYKNSISDENLIAGETLNAETGKYEAIGYNGTWYLVDSTHESPDFGVAHLGDNTFHIHFRNTFVNQISATDKIIVTYSATLNTDAVIAGDGNPNTVYLAWGNAQETTYDTVKTYSWELPILKYTKSASEEEIPLAGAQFIIGKDRGTEDHGYVKSVDENGKITMWTYNRDEAYIFVTDSTGKFAVSGLDSDKHFVEEIEAPVGYNKLTAPIYIVIDEDGVIRDTGSAVLTTLKIVNNTGTELPSTGGLGTTLFIAIGMFGVLFFGVLMVTNKRMKKEGF